MKARNGLGHGDETSDQDEMPPGAEMPQRTGATVRGRVRRDMGHGREGWQCLGGPRHERRRAQGRLRDAVWKDKVQGQGGTAADGGKAGRSGRPLDSVIQGQHHLGFLVRLFDLAVQHEQALRRYALVLHQKLLGVLGPAHGEAAQGLGGD